MVVEFPVTAVVLFTVRVPLAEAAQTILPPPVLVGALLITIVFVVKLAVPFIVIVWLLAVLFALNVVAPLTIVVEPSAREKLFAAVGLESVSAPIVTVPDVLSFESALFVGIVMVPPQVMLLEPANASAPVPVIVIAPVLVLNVLPL